jgi:hypothetical protein
VPDKANYSGDAGDRSRAGATGCAGPVSDDTRAHHRHAVLGLRNTFQVDQKGGFTSKDAKNTATLTDPLVHRRPLAAGTASGPYIGIAM